MRHYALRWFCLCAALVLLHGNAAAQYEPDWTRNFRLGVPVGFNIKADFRTTGSFLTGGDPGPTGVPGANHIYDDGYVRVDDFNNAGGFTTFWGYEDPAQYDPATQTLFMHSASSYSLSGGGSANETAHFGMDLAYGGYLWHRHPFRIGVEFGFGWLPIYISQDFNAMAQVSQVTHAFSVPDGVVLPQAPYNGSSSGFGQPAISDTATLVGTDTINGSVTGTRTLDVTLYTFRLGPTLFWDVHPRVGLTLSAGPALGFIDGEYRFRENIVTSGASQSRGGFDVSDTVFGGYVNAMITYHAVSNGDLYLAAQYMPLGTPRFSRGGRQAELELNGAVYVSAGINWPF